MSKPEQMLNLAQVCDKVGLRKSAIYDLIRNGDPQFPEPLKFGSASRWIESEIDDWIYENRTRQRMAG